MANGSNTFENGSIWLKADFHLHTRADKEFEYEGKGSDFAKEYVEQLEEHDIKVGIITNHNKFDKNEFNELRSKAAKNSIALFPGIEFSLKEGIHIIITFDYEWYQGYEDNIKDFLSAAFYGIPNSDIPPYPNSKFDLNETVEKLDEIGLDYFIIMAHVDTDNGLFEVFFGRTLDAFMNSNSFDRVLALQKSGNRENYNRIVSILKRQIACVEGTDNANEGISAIGKGRITYIKIGDFNFKALKYSLTDNQNRVKAKEKPRINNAYVKSIAFEGGLLDETKINLSPELNNFIGIRGSGKSSVLEILRYTLGISLGSQASDRDYKNNLIEHVLESGGKVIVTVVDEHKKEYRIEKIYGQKEDIYDNDGRVDAPSVDTVFQQPVYFGQKDLSNKDIDFEADLVRKLIGNRLENIKSKTNQKMDEIENIVSAYRKLDNLDELKKEVNNNIKDAKHKLKLYKEKGVEDKLRQQSRFDLDESKFKESLNEISNFRNDLESLINDYTAFFHETAFESEENKEIFLEADTLFKQVVIEFNKLNDIKSNTAKYADTFKGIFEKLNEKKENLKEEFAKIKREIDIPNLNPDDFLKLNRQVETSKSKLIEIDKSEKKRIEYTTSLNNKISELNNLWHEEHHVLEKEVKRINDYDSSLSISVEYKGRNDKFLEKLHQLLKGSGIREATYTTIQSTYKDFVEIYRDMGNLGARLNISKSLLAEFEKRFNDNVLDLVTFRVEDRFIIKYNNKPLKDHSLGQRATALILFLLAQKETSVLIIDQPEDDLDNQTIYEDVIKAIKSLKGKMQFIFATHNANIPVLGDSEKVISCKYSEDKIDIYGGTIDDQNTQKQIVTIMEGGEEAFSRRKNIYEMWSMKK